MGQGQYTPILAGPVRLRDWQLADLDAYAALAPGQPWQALDGPYDPPLSSAQMVERLARLQHAIAIGDWPEPRTRLVIADRATDVLLGVVSWYWISRETNWLVLGITIFEPHHWRKGYGTAALGLWCTYLWSAFPHLVRLDLRTWSGNLGMMALAHRLGFREEARFRLARIVDGHYYDGLGYGILRSEWEARPGGLCGVAAHLLRCVRCEIRRESRHKGL